MKNADADRRTRKTKALLRQTLTRLLMEKDLKDITVSELTERADINRGTFYLHYKDIYDLFDQTEKEILDDFTAIIFKHQKNQEQLVWLPVLLELFKYIAANAEIFIAILRTQETTFLTKIIAMSRPQAITDWQKLFGNGNQALYEYYYAFITSGCVAMLRLWFDEGMPESPEYMAALAGKMIENAVMSM